MPTTATGADVEAVLTDDTLTVTRCGETFVLPLANVECVKHTPPRLGGVVNGHVVVRTTDGLEVEMHYRVTDDDFPPLIDALGAATSS